MLHPGDADVIAKIAVGPSIVRGIDLLEDRTFEVRGGSLEVRMKAKSVRMIAVG